MVKASKSSIPITGQLFFRKTGSKMAGKGRKLMMVVGVIAVPEDTTIKGEHQYAVMGTGDALRILPETEIDRTEMANGLAIGSLVTFPIWRC